MDAHDVLAGIHRCFERFGEVMGPHQTWVVSSLFQGRVYVFRSPGEDVICLCAGTWEMLVEHDLKVRHDLAGVEHWRLPTPFMVDDRALDDPEAEAYRKKEWERVRAKIVDTWSREVGLDQDLFSPLGEQLACIKLHH